MTSHPRVLSVKYQMHQSTTDCSNCLYYMREYAYLAANGLVPLSN